jgi:predicted RNA-binding protein
MVMEKSGVSADGLVKAYVNIRSKREELSKEYDSKDSELASQLNLIKEELLKLCASIDADSIKTGSGTITRTVKTKYMTTDWEAVYEFIKENDAVEILEKRIHQGNLRSLIEENPDLLPKGMNCLREYAITVRRSR